MKSIKISWIRRYKATNADWGLVAATEISNIQDTICYGSKKILRICKNITNPFWRDVLEAYASFSSVLQPSMPEILSEKLWCSDYSRFNYTTIKTWDTKGIRFLADLINENTGKLHTKQTLENHFNIKMTFLCFTGLLKSLPGCLKLEKVVKEFGPIIPVRMNLLMNHSHLNRCVYDTYLESERSKLTKVNTRLKDKWIRDIGSFDEDNFIKIMSVTNSTRYRMIHYKLINRVLATNKFLKVINVKEDDRCTFCQNEPETIVHVFWYCARVQAFVNSIREVIFRKYQITADINPKSWFFTTDLDVAASCIILLAKIVIYEARLNETSPDINHLKNKLKQEVEVEYHSARTGSRIDILEKKWGALKDIHRQ